MKNDNSVVVSVIITNFNYAHFLADALDSVLNQNFEQWECLIVDDGSTDNSKEVAEQYTLKDARFRYIYQHNQGLAASRNNGMAIAKGKYYQFLDADDKICPHKLSEHANYLDKHPDVDIVYGDYSYFETESPQFLFSSKKKDKLEKTYYPSGNGIFMLDKLVSNNFTVVSAPLIRKTVLDKGIKFDTSYNTFEDWRFWIDCALQNCTFQYVSIPDTETHIRFGHSSMMSALIKMNLGGQKIRKYLHPHLNLRQKLYNSYRMIKLLAKFYYLKTFGG